MSENTKSRLAFIVNAAFIAVVIVLVYLGFRVAGIALPFLIALLLVGLLQPLIRWLHRKLHISRKILSAAMLIFLYAIVGTLLFVLVFQLVFLLKDVFQTFPDYYQSTIAPLLSNLAEQLNALVAKLPPDLFEDFALVQDNLLSGLQNLVGFISQKGIGLVSGVVNNIPGFFVGLVFTIMLSCCISLQYDSIMDFLRARLPERAKTFLTGTGTLTKQTLGRYLRAILILMALTFVELSIGLAAIGAGNPIATAAFIAIFDALPVFGTGGIMIPWVVIELLQGNFSFAIGLLIVYGIVTVVRNVVEPKVISDQLGIPPVVSLLSIYIGFRLFGVVGMITFPMLAQILLVLHKDGRIRLYKEWSTEPDPEPAP